MSKNYEEMSDFGINKLIAKLKYNHPRDPEYFKFYRLDKGSAVQVNAYKMWPQNLDFCNNPSDAWPIIFENKIATEWHHADVWRAQCDNQHKPGAYKVFTSYCYNPLRAAMICFLKMKEAESDHA